MTSDASSSLAPSLASQLREAFEQSPVSTVVYDAAGRPLAANPAFQRLWGVGLSDVPAGYSVLADPQLEAAGVLPSLRRAFGLDGAHDGQGAGEAVQLPALRYDVASTTGRGHVRWTQAHAYPVRGATGAVERVVLSHEDVTARLEAERAVREALAAVELREREVRAVEERLRLALDSTGLGTWDYVPATDTLVWDARAKQAFGLPEHGEVRNHAAFLALVHPEDRARTQAVVNASLDPAGSGEYDTIFRVAPHDGVIRWIRARGRALFAGTGAERHVARFIGTLLDVTAERTASAERERLVAALEIERSRLSAVFAQTPSVLAILRGPDHVLEMANAAYLALNGHRDVLGKPLLEAAPELREQGFDRLLDAVVATGEPFIGREVSAWLSTSVGAPPEERIFDFVYLPLLEPDETGMPVRVGVIAHGSDMTTQVRARRDVERARERADRLQALTVALAATTTPDAVAEVVVAQAVAVAGAATGILVLRASHPSGEDASELVTLRFTGLPSDVSAAYDRFPLGAPVPTATSVRTGEAFFLEEPAALHAAFPAIPHVFDGLGAQAIATVPLTVGGDVIGAMSFTFTTPRAFPAEDREFFLALGRQAAQALERARLFESERTARRRTEALQQVTAALARAQTMEDVGRVFSREITALVPADTAWVGVVAPDGTTIEALGWNGYEQRMVDAWRRLSLDSRMALTDAVRTATPQWWPTRDALADAYPARAAVIRTLDQEGVAVLPLLAAGDVEHDDSDGPTEARALGGIVVGFRTPQSFDADTRGFFLALAQQCTQSIGRARAYEAEQRARREAESARAAAETANRAKSDFLAVMSHELRTPLNAIGGYAELMEMGIRGPVTPQQVEDLRRVQASQRHLLGLVNEVLNYARIETGSVHYETTDVPLAAVIAAVEPLVAPQLAAKSLVFTSRGCDGWANAPAVVARADREKVRQVLLNLLSNAIKFTPAGGAVEVECAAAGEHVSVRVTDTGIGIAAEELQRIFEPFVQVNASLTRTHEGTGLGLAISRDLARGMGGDLTVESTVGHGSSFTLTLPLA